ncbi:MAG TPA: hypothetical protein VK155_01980 [Bacteroidales bacterium]|nr:hypothetical protein [Bacteroidales bacterium]
MKYLMRVKMSKDSGNSSLMDPDFGKKMREVLTEVKAENAYFTTIDGCRGGYIVVNIDNPSQMPAISEPFFLWLNAEIDFYPVMSPDDLEKAAPAIEKAVKKWGRHVEQYSQV